MHCIEQLKPFLSMWQNQKNDRDDDVPLEVGHVLCRIPVIQHHQRQLESSREVEANVPAKSILLYQTQTHFNYKIK